MSDIYTRFGRLREAYEMTMELLQAIKSGVVDIDDVIIGDAGWAYNPEEDDDESE